MTDREGGEGGKHLREPTVEEQALAVMHGHRVKHGIRDMKLHCWCGWTTDLGRGAGTRHWEHVVDELRISRLLVHSAHGVDGVDPDRLVGVARSAALLAPVANSGEAAAAFHIITQTGIVEAVVAAVLTELGLGGSDQV